MTKYLSRTIVLICIFSLLCSSVSAATHASDQISSYETNAFHSGGGDISILVSVIGTGYMSSLGASNIFVYEKVGSVWKEFATFTSSDAGMCSYDSTFHDRYITCDAYTGGEFRVDIIIFAEDYSGNSDSRSRTHYVYT